MFAVQNEFHSVTLVTASAGAGHDHVQGSGEMLQRNKEDEPTELLSEFYTMHVNNFILLQLKELKNH